MSENGVLSCAPFYLIEITCLWKVVLCVISPLSVFILQIVAHCLAYCNSCLNPILYAFFSPNFRHAFRKAMLPCVSVCSGAKRRLLASRDATGDDDLNAGTGPEEEERACDEEDPNAQRLANETPGNCLSLNVGYFYIICFLYVIILVLL